MTYQKCDRCGSSTESNKGKTYGLIEIQTITLTTFSSDNYRDADELEGGSRDLCEPCAKEVNRVFKEVLPKVNKS